MKESTGRILTLAGTPGSVPLPRRPGCLDREEWLLVEGLNGRRPSLKDWQSSEDAVWLAVGTRFIADSLQHGADKPQTVSENNGSFALHLYAL